MERVCKLREGRLQACPPWSEHSDRGHAQTFVSSRQTFVASLTDYEITASSLLSHTAWAPMMLVLATLTSGYTLRAAVRPAAAVRCVAARCDADRCYYGRVDEDGNVLKGVAEVRSP